MIRPGPSRVRRGQILVVEVHDTAVVVDCLLCSDDNPTALLASFRVRVTGTTAGSVVELLRRWQHDDDLIDVRLGEGPRGAQVQISSAMTRLMLEPDD